MPVDSAPKASRREGIGLAVIGLTCLLYSIDVTVVELAMQKLTCTSDPRAPSSCGSWISTASCWPDSLSRWAIRETGSGLRHRSPLGTRCLLRHRGDVEHHTRRARRRRGHAGALHPLADPQHVPKPGSARLRHRGAGHELRGRRRHRAVGRRVAARAFLVGVLSSC
jgi:hypothetical protein